MGDVTSWLRLLELSGAGGVLILGFIFLFRWLLPKIISAFADGMQRISEALKTVNTTLKAIQKCQKVNAEKLAEIFREETRHSYERTEDSVKDAVTACQNAERSVIKMESELSQLTTKVDALTSQLG
jgi:single-stranded DNA-specific DHH superfamily exonuclease